MYSSNELTITIVIPAYNRASTLHRCLHSVLTQTYPPAEVIVVDDCSTDDSADIVRGYAAKRVRSIVLEKNSGAQAARNRGIREASGDWIAFQDSDDEWTPEKLEKQVDALREVNFDPMTVVHTDCRCFDPISGQKDIWSQTVADGPDVLARLLTKPGPTFPSFLTSKAALEKIGFLDEKVPSFHEWDTAIRLAKYCRFIHIQEPLFIYHLHSGETISKNRIRDISGYQYIVDKFRDDIIEHCGRQTYNEHLIINAMKAMNWGYFDEAMNIMNKIIDPSFNIFLFKLMCVLRVELKYYELLKKWALFIKAIPGILVQKVKGKS